MPTPAANIAPRWMRLVLYAAAAYNLVWGAVVVLFPAATLELLGIGDARYPQLWQCIGMIVGVYGLGYAIAARDPLRHWPIVLVGFLGKVFGPVGFVMAIAAGDLPLRMGWTILTNDLVWWLPFAGILLAAARHHQQPAIDPAGEYPSVQAALADTRADTGQTLDALSRQSPLLLVFLRHFGCTFCREAVADLSARKDQIDARGVRVVFVHMSPYSEAVPFFKQFGLENPLNVSDPTGRLYRAMGLRRMDVLDIFRPRVWWRGFLAAVLRRHWFGRLRGDGFQMPGTFLVDHGRVVASHISTDAADHADFDAMTCRVPVETSPP